MSQRYNPKPSLGALGGPIERLAQANVALILTQAIIIRLAVELAATADGDPDPLLLLGMLAACAAAGAIVVALRRVIRHFPRRWHRIAIALGSLFLQAGAFQLIHAWAS